MILRDSKNTESADSKNSQVAGFLGIVKVVTLVGEVFQMRNRGFFVPLRFTSL